MEQHGEQIRRPGGRRWFADVALVGLAVVLGMLFLLGSDPERLRFPILGVELGVGAAAVAALLLFRRRRPVALALVLIPVGIVTALPMGATMVGLFSVAERRPWPVAVAVAGLHATLVAAVYRLEVDDLHEYWEVMWVLVLLDVAVVAGGMLLRSHRRLVRSLRERARQAHESQRLRVEEAKHAEREQLAREMHDVLAHRVSLLAVHAGALEFRRDATEPERLAAGVVRQCAHDVLEDLREVIGMLRGPTVADEAERPQPTISDLPALVERSRRAGARVTLDTRVADRPPVPDGVGRHVYRIVQEGLSNARQHAPGARIRVTVAAPADAGPAAGSPADAGPAAGSLGDADHPVRSGSGAGVAVEVVNRLPDGAVGLADSGAGTGLIGLRERVQLAGGRLDHGPTPQGEFRLRAWLPWRA